MRFYSIEDLLGDDSQYKDAFANGALTHSFLNVNDYHRYHFAVGGEIKEKEIISQNVALEVAWNETEGKYDGMAVLSDPRLCDSGYGRIRACRPYTHGHGPGLLRQLRG